jgi:hypothetical protein
LQPMRVGLEAEKFVRCGDQAQREDSDGDFAYDSHGEGTEALLAHFAEVGSQADAGKVNRKAQRERFARAVT